VIYLFGTNQSYCYKYKKDHSKHHGFTVITGSKEYNPVLINSDDYSKALAKLELYKEDFYTNNIIEYYLLITKYRERKERFNYTSVLKLIGIALTYYEALSWENLKDDFWEELITFEFLNSTINIISYKQADNFFSVLIQFLNG
jgi:hypothetical protein